MSNDSSDSEAPDDLFPEEILAEGETGQPSPQDEELARLWDTAKTRVWHLNVQDWQISDWFEKRPFSRPLSGSPAGRKQDVNSLLKKMNIEHRTSNIERLISDF